MSGYAGINPKEDGAVPFTKANAREMCLRGLAVVDIFVNNVRCGNLPPLTSLPKWKNSTLCSDSRERKRFIDNKYKLIFPALKKHMTREH